MPPLEWAIYEYPLEAWGEIGGSKFGIDDAWDSLWDLGQIFWENAWFGSRYRESPWWSWGFGRKRSAEDAEYNEVRAYEEREAEDAKAQSASLERSAVEESTSDEDESIQDELAMIEETLSDTANIDESEIETSDVVEALEDIREEGTIQPQRKFVSSR